MLYCGWPTSHRWSGKWSHHPQNTSWWTPKAFWGLCDTTGAFGSGCDHPQSPSKVVWPPTSFQGFLFIYFKKKKEIIWGFLVILI
jgi:hypothetical protein